MSMETITESEAVDQLSSIMNDFESDDIVSQDKPKASKAKKEDDEDIEDDIDDEDEDTDTEPEEDDDEPEEEEEDEDTDDEDEDDSDDEDEEDSEEESHPDEVDIDDKDFTITIDGEPVVVKGGELKYGYMRQSDYTKKTQELQSARAEATEALEVARRNTTLSQVKALEAINTFDKIISDNGGWDNLKLSADPDEFSRFTEAYRAAQKDAKESQAYIDEYEHKLRAQSAKEALQCVQGLYEKIPGFNDKTWNKLSDYVISNGITDEMAASITLPSAWEMMFKAMKYDDAQKRIAKKKGSDVESDTTTTTKAKKTHSAPVKPIKSTESKKRKLNKALNLQRKARSGAEGDAAAVNALSLLLGNN